MEGMVKALGKYGGDIIKFVGDAMIVMWPRIPQSVFDGRRNDMNEKGGAQTQREFDSEAGESKESIIRKALQCALDIQNELNNKKIMSNVTNLSVKVSCSNLTADLDRNWLWRLCSSLCRWSLQQS